MMPRARCVIRYLYRSARVAGVEPARIIANGEKAAATRLETRRSRDPPPPPAMPETNALCGARAKEMRYAEQGPRGEQPRFTRGGRTSGAKSWLEHIADSPVVVVYRFTTGGIPADAR